MPTYTYQQDPDSVPDSEIQSGSPNQGSSTQLYVWWDGSSNNIQRSIIEFDLSDIPSYEAVQSAELKLYCWDAAASAYAFKVRRLTEAGWTEGGVTWITYDGTNNWATQGGDYTATGEVDANLPTATGDFTITGLKDLVIDAIQNRSDRLILILMGADGLATSDGAGFRSGEYATGSQRPELTVVTDFQTEKTTYTETDTPADVGAIAACSGLGIATGADARKAIESGTAGTGTNTATIPKSSAKAAFMFEITPNHAVAWTAGRWSIRWKTGATIQGGPDITWDETWICRVNSSGTNKATIASVTAQGVSLAANTEYGVSMTGTKQIHASGDRVYIILGIKNANATTNFDVTMIPALDIETPILALSQTGFTLPTTTGSPTDQWTNGANLTASDYNRAQEDVAGRKEDTATYGFNLGAGSQIYGFEVEAEGKANGTIDVDSADLRVDLSWDGGTTYTSPKDMTFIARGKFDPDDTKTYGSPDDDWGHDPWTLAQINDTNFRCRIEFELSEFGDFNGIGRGMDSVKVNIYYTAGGGNAMPMASSIHRWRRSA